MLSHATVIESTAIGSDPATAAASHKATARKLLRATRRQLSPRFRRLAAHRAAHRACELRMIRRARHIAVYISVGTELDTAPLIARLNRLARHVYIPAVDRNRRMDFLPLRAGERLRRDALGLPRSAAASARRPTRKLDVVIVPLVGFSPDGTRLGAGGGFYDRTFAFRSAGLRAPRLIGYAYTEQCLPGLPRESFDVTMDAIVTDRRFIACHTLL
jgi:5-formyltetrahydrofolate cyclo-ligase